jgi:hypothetical protein
MLLALLLYARSMSDPFDGRPHILPQTEAWHPALGIRYNPRRHMESIMAERSTRAKTALTSGAKIYELEVCLLGGIVTNRFIKSNPVLSRTIQIRGDQTLTKLHEGIFKAFERFDEHMYLFELGGKGPRDPKANRYVLPMEAESIFGERSPAGFVTKTTIDDLGLKEGQAFAYWFDFGDDWWHQINVKAIHEGPGAGKYPRVTAKVGKCPPQYPDLGEDEEGE